MLDRCTVHEYVTAYADADDAYSDFPRRYFHGDLIDSTMMLTDKVGLVADPGAWSYTAFGDNGSTGAVPNQSTAIRHGYAGGYGYETGLLTLVGTNPDYPPITLLHVGERWYQPDIGRFVQRDPIGIAGGLNVYAYGTNNPLVRVDPLGLMGLEPPTTQDAGRAGRALVDEVVGRVVKKFTFGVRKTGEIVYNVCVVWVWVQEQNKKMFRPPAPPPPQRLPCWCANPQCSGTHIHAPGAGP